MTAADQLRARVVRPDARSATQFDPLAVLNEEQVEALADVVDALEASIAANLATGEANRNSPSEQAAYQQASAALARVTAALGDTDTVTARDDGERSGWEWGQ